MDRMEENETERQFALCIENKDSEDLEKRKIHQVIPDAEAKTEGYLERYERLLQQFSLSSVKQMALATAVAAAKAGDIYQPSV